jgi:Uma2 family endonuclease
MVASKRRKLHSIDEFEAFIGLPENADRLFELINGEIVEKVPTEEHSLIVGNPYYVLRVFVDERGLGRVAFEVRRKMPDDAHNARLPDVEFTAQERLLPVVKKGAVPQMPDLAVEVKSPDDNLSKLREKAAYYLANGTRLVWLVYPEKRLIIVLTPDSEEILTENDALTGGDVLPGFEVPVERIFSVS